MLSHQTALVLDDLEKENRFPQSTDPLRERGVRSYCVLPMTVGNRRLGAIGFGSTRAGAFAPQDTQLLRRVAQLVAMTVDSSLSQRVVRRKGAFPRVVGSKPHVNLHA